MNFLKKGFIILLVINMTASDKDLLSAQKANLNFQIFYDDLSPYGSWVTYRDFGYAWIPSAGIDFFPYSTAGYWVYTDFGWTWVSEYPWGWAPFHYGRWIYDDFYGWVWIPGDEWGPAWVVWRHSPGYYGWAPLGPRISINVVINGTYQPSYESWIFVDEHYIGRRDIQNYYGPRKDNTKLISNSTIVSNTREEKGTGRYLTGPDKREIQQVTGKSIEQVSIRETSKPDQQLKNNQLSLYRPAISKSGEAKPAKVTTKNEIKPVSERKQTEKQVKEIPQRQENQGNEKELPKKNTDDKNQQVAPGKEKPQPVVPDNTRTKEPPKTLPENNDIKEKPKSEKNVDHKQMEDRKIIEQRQTQTPSKQNMPPPVHPQPRTNPPTPNPSPAPSPRPPSHPPKRGPH